MWVYVDRHITEDMQGACTCIHLHAPEAPGTTRDDKESGKGFPTPLPKRSSVSISKPKPHTYTYKTLRLEDLPSDTEWWAARQLQFPGVNLQEELSKAQDWPRAHKVKNAKLYFRNWLAKAKPTRLVVVRPSVEEQLAAMKRRAP